METRLTGRPYAHLFWQAAVKNINYWRDYIAGHQADNAALQQERRQIINALDYALELPEAWPAVRTVVESFSPYMERWGYWSQWQKILHSAAQMARAYEDKPGEVKLLILLARLAQRRSQFQEVAVNYRRASRLARQLGDAESEARACSNLGFLYTELGDTWRAKVLGCHALAIFERLEHAHGCAHTHNHLGLLAIRQRHWQAAQQHLERACQIWQDNNDIHSMMLGFINLGQLYIEAAQPEHALHYLHEALQHAETTGEETEIANIYNNIGICYDLKNDPIQAETYYWQAEAIFQRTSNVLGLTRVSANLGLACSAQKKWTAAKQHLETALAGYRLLKNPYREMRIILYLIKFELARSNNEGAVKWLAEVTYQLKPYEDNETYQDLRTQVRDYQQQLGISLSLGGT